MQQQISNNYKTIQVYRIYIHQKGKGRKYIQLIRDEWREEIYGISTYFDHQDKESFSNMKPGHCWNNQNWICDYSYIYQGNTQEIKLMS